jgi:hypothetical protein
MIRLFWYSLRKLQERGRMAAPTNPIVSKDVHRIFTKIKMEKKTKRRMMDVPRSGCLRIKPVGKRRSRKGKGRSFNE